MKSSTPLRVCWWIAVGLLMSCRVAGPLSPRYDEPSAPTPAPIPAAVQLPPKAAPVQIDEPPPISLTASDGTGLTLATLQAHAVVDDPVAITQVELAFDNPRDREMEGRFELLLPPGAQVTRFAMKIGGQWQEAELVEKQRARQTYETFLHQRRDPALLERDAGNRFRARVFPIAPRERKELIVSYVQTMPDPHKPYRFSTRGLPWMEQLDLHVLVGVPGEARYHVEQRHLREQRPQQDLVVQRPQVTTVGLRRGEHVVARIEPLLGLDPGEARPIRSLTVLMDTSASRALDFDQTVDGLGRLMKALGRHSAGTQLEVFAFDQTVVPIYEGPLVDFGPDALSTLRARRPLGASDLDAALAFIGKGEGKRKRVLLVSDGLISAGSESESDLDDRLAALRDAGIERVDALAVGTIRDEDRLAQLVTGPLPHGGVVLDATHDLERSALRLLQPTMDNVRLRVPGATWFRPQTLQGVQPGDHVIVYAELPGNRPLQVQVTGATTHVQSIALEQTASPLVDHMWMHGKVQGMVDRLATMHDATRSEKLRQQVIDLSVRHRVFNDFTAFLVLETNADYARFGLDRKGLSDILVVEPTGVRIEDRRPSAKVRSSTDARRASTGTGAISGTVADATTGSRIPDAVVVLQCTCLAQPRETQTDAEGLFTFGGLPAGTFTVQVLTAQTATTQLLDLPRGEREKLAFEVVPSSPGRTLLLEEPGPGPAPVPDDAVRVHVQAQPQSQQTSVGRTVTMEEFRNIPVGNSESRDFTQVVESSATASSDAAGISLAGTTGAESHYVIRGGSMSGMGRGRPPSPPRPPKVTLGPTKVLGEGVDKREVERRLARIKAGIRTCYHDALRDDRVVWGRVRVELQIDGTGHVTAVDKRRQWRLDDAELLACVDDRLRELVFDSDGIHTSSATVTLKFRLRDGPDAIEDDDDETPTMAEPAALPTPEAPTPASDGFGLPQIDNLLGAEQHHEALTRAWAWRESAPSDLLALVGLGRAAEANGHLALAARAYGSILDLYPSRADMHRFAAGQLETLDDDALALAIDAYRKAKEERPDHPSSHRNLGFALLHANKPREAFDVLSTGLLHRYPDGRFLAVRRILREDLGIAAAVWIRQHPDDRLEIRRRLHEMGASLATEPSLRFVLTWETDANDVDLHVLDRHGGHAYYASRTLPSGGDLYADVVNGFGPECLTIDGPPTAYPYTLQVHYYARGPMGFGLGKVQVVHHDGKGGLELGDRPFVVLEDRATVDLGEVSPPLRHIAKRKP